MHRWHGWILGWAILVGGIGCKEPVSDRPRVVATTGMIADLARQIGGEHIQVDGLMGPGVDPHRYCATAGDISRLSSAQLILYNGLHLEGKMIDVFADLSQSVKTLAVIEALDREKDLLPAAEGFEGIYDPHVWFDVALWAKTIDSVRNALIEIAPAHAETFRQNAERYRQQLLALHDEVRQKALKIPKERRVLITSHDAFHYFGRAYDFEVHGLQGVSTASDTGTKDVQQLAQLIGRRKIPAIFAETSVPDRGVRAVQDAVRKDAKFEVRLSPDRLYSDALGEPGTGGETYIGMVRHNIDAIVRALGESSP